MRFFLPLLASLAVAFAPAPLQRPDPTKTELKKLQGEWVRVRVVTGGVSNLAQTSTVVVIKGDRLEYRSGVGRPSEWALTVEAGKKPRVFDIRGVSGEVKQFVYWGIYRLEGDTLTVCSRLGGPETGRPTRFDASSAGFYLEVFKRRR